MKIEPATIDSANNMEMLKTLDIHLKEIGETHAVVEVVVSERHKNYLGGAHGGLIATLIDTVSFFCKPLLPSGTLCTTASLNVHYIRPALMGEKLTARSELTHIGKRMATINATVHNSRHKLVAHGTVTVMMLTQGAA
ncbi:MAG: PaaI family thioesterase [Desulfuromonadaceae bacterium]|nr:PaaI family thioesterase [Desulfuromonadaceae bacterium]